MKCDCEKINVNLQNPSNFSFKQLLMVGKNATHISMFDPKH